MPDNLDDQIQGELDDSPLTGGGDGTAEAPGYNPQRWNAFSEVPMANPAVPAQQPPAPTAGIGGSFGYKGLPPGVSAPGDYGRAEKRAKAQSDSMAGDRQAENASLDRDFAAQARATQAEADAEDLHGQLTTNILRQKRAYDMAAATLEEKAAAESRAKSQQLLSSYQEQIAGVRALAAQSGNPMFTTTKPEQIGLVGAMFAQGFLAPRGIHIDVAGQIDRWVERGIQEHQMQVQNAREAAGDTLHLYEIARQTSQDDFEARQRYRGFVLEGFKTSLEMEAARSGSQIAKARAQDVIAKAQLEQDKTKIAMRDRWFTQDQALRTQAISETHMMHQDEIESMRAQADLLHAKATANTKKVEAPIFYSDNSQVQKDPTGRPITGGKFLWGVRPQATNLPEGAIAKGIEDANKATAGRDSLRDAIQRFRELRSQIDSFGGPDALRLYPEKARWVEQQRVLIANTMKKGMEGLRGSDQDQSRFEKLIDKDHWLQEGDNRSLVDNLDEWSREQFKNEMNANKALYKVGEPGTDAPPSAYDIPNEVDPATKARGSTLLAPPPNIGTPARAEAEVVGAKNDDAGQTNTSQAMVDYIKQTGKQPSRYLASDGQRAEFVGIDRLALAAADPERAIAGQEELKRFGVRPIDEDPKALKAQSLTSLRHIANGYISSGHPVSEEARDYAKWVLDRVENPVSGPNSVGDLFTGSDEAARSLYGGNAR